MPRIQQLPNSLINQIAAGEVIERPASVVKEIIENAIDAGATQIDIDIEDGGGKLIRVRDNGCGIHPDDLALAFATHATSKIRNLDDLEHITTLGFRGEALPSIASVSKTTLTSRAEGESSAWRISPHLGDAISPAAHPPGTTIEIRDLFYNTPARKKFLKSERTERQHIQQLVQNLALSHDGITIRLNNHGKPLGVYGGEGLAARIASVLGDDLLEQALPIDARAADMHLYGWVGLPTSATNQPERQYFYINGRIIRDKIIAHAIRQAYQDMLYHGRHPVYVLYLDIAPEHIDVNAHPAKHEVRFRESRLTHDFLYSSLHHALRGNTPAAAPRPENPAPPPECEVPAVARQQPLRYSGDYRLERPTTPRRALAESAAYYQWAQNIAPSPVHPGGSTSTNPTPSPSPMWGGEQDYAAAPVNDDQTEHPLGYALGQIHNIFILAQNARGLVIVDMHAAHERILYERLKAQLRARHPEVQRLLLPQSLAATPAHLDTLAQHRDWLHRLGFDLEASADESRIHINAVPSLLKHAAVAEIVGDLLHELGEYPASIAIERLQDEILSRLSCHKAVRAHDSLTIPEMNHLLRDIETTPASGQCNHGRPTWVQLTTDELGKYFMRGE
ncbi:DNA mismatch repair endonuclease MutL [Cardiobacterium hominis]|uniref:DNA mismatch repair endonuclease MutL n=1 Tax=Cardiobacterium hominis TaxID=2718 RepID=UPI000660F19D|nr:DNA mismatch repair endonuclease MutL [Cardiobacterium hominis]